LGYEIVRVPPDWRHLVDEDGEWMEGAHHEPLYDLDAAARTAIQLYENTSEGSPVSPVFGSMAELEAWLRQNGWSEQRSQFLLANGFAPVLITGVSEQPATEPYLPGTEPYYNADKARYVSFGADSQPADAYVAVVRRISPPLIKRGRVFLHNFILTTPDGTAFYPLTYQGDAQWPRQIDLGAERLGLVTAEIRDKTIFVISDGRSFPIADCTVQRVTPPTD
jgi:hypothetical protein